MKLYVVSYWDEHRKRRLFTLSTHKPSFSNHRPEIPKINGELLIFTTQQQAQEFASHLRDGDLDGSAASPEFFYH